MIQKQIQTPSDDETSRLVYTVDQKQARKPRSQVSFETLPTDPAYGWLTGVDTLVSDVAEKLDMQQKCYICGCATAHPSEEFDKFYN